MLDAARSSAKTAAIGAARLADLKTAYDRDGFVAVEGLLAVDEVETLRAEIVAVALGERGEIAGAEPRAGRSDEALVGDILAIHMPHKISPLVRATMAHPRIVPILESLIGPDVKAMQTMLFVKRAGKPGQAWHQDEHYIPTRDRSLCGAWIALDNATIENGCLWVLPGSHRTGYLYAQREHGNPDEFDFAKESFGFDESAEAPVEVATGSLVFFNGYLLHR